VAARISCYLALTHGSCGRGFVSVLLWEMCSIYLVRLDVLLCRLFLYVAMK
jgi:hypothetical protein